jgi:hypothetical protein
MTMEVSDRVRFDGDFSLSLWIEVPVHRAGAAGGLASKFDPATRTGFTLATVSSAGGYNGPGDELRVSFGIDARTSPSWVDCGRPSLTANHVTSLVVYRGALYCGNNEAAAERDYAHVFRWQGGADWEDLGQVASDGTRGIGPLVVHKDALYAAGWNHDWTRVTYHNLRPCHVFRFDGPGRWADCGQPGNSKRIFAMASYDGDLYAVGDDFSIQVYRGDEQWELVERLPTFGHPMTVHAGRLVIGTWEHPPTVLAYDGASWTDLGNPMGDIVRASQIHSLTTFESAIHVGHWPLGSVCRWDEASRQWQDTGRLGDSTEINALTSYNGKLYAGALPRAEVFRYDGDFAWHSLRRFRASPSWEPISVEEMERPPDGDLRMRDWGRVTSLTQHNGLLFGSVTSCTGSVIDAPADIRGSVQAMRAGVVATTSESLGSGWHHLAAVRDGARLTLHIDGRVAASAYGSLPASIETAVPVAVGSDPSGKFGGEIQDFQAFDRVLDARDIGRLSERRRD